MTMGSTIQAAGKTRITACRLRKEFIKRMCPENPSDAVNLLNLLRVRTQPPLPSPGGVLKLTDSGPLAGRPQVPALAAGRGQVPCCPISVRRSGNRDCWRDRSGAACPREKS